jgi:hypothetical protein
MSHPAKPQPDCVHFWTPERYAQERASLGGRGAELAECAVGADTSDEGVLRVVAEGLGLPSYFGMNWDALDEALGDLPEPAAEGRVLVLRSASQLWDRNPEAAGRLISVWLLGAARWAKRGKGLHLIFLVEWLEA